MSRAYIDPTLPPPRTDIERAIFDAVRKNGLSLHRLHANTRAVRVTGPGGLHIVAESLAWVKLADLTYNPNA